MNKKFFWFLGVFIILYFIVQLVSRFYIDYEWFKAYGHTGIFWTLFVTKFNVQGFFTVLFVVLFFLNFMLIRILAGKGKVFSQNILDRIQIKGFGTPRRMLFIIVSVGAVILGFFLGLGASAYWKEYLVFNNATPFINFPHDPIFNKELGFYILKLPFITFILGWMMLSVILITIFSLLFHLLNGGIFIKSGKIEFSLFARIHLSILFAVIVLIMGLNYRISAYDLLFTDRGKFFGAGYTAVNANLLAYNVCMVISFIASGLLLVNVIVKSFKLPAVILLALIPAYFLLGTIYPSLQQRFVVDPNELTKEKPFIESNIKFTRLAYDIERVKEKPFANNQNLSYRDLLRNKNTIENIRLWDWRPLKQTYKQLQELKPYYNFNDVDVDRYIINGKKTAVNLSARELAINKLSSQSRSWVNEHLVYTHGYGFVLSRVDKITPEGLPELLVYDIPPNTRLPMKIKRPEIYYGEHNNPYVITKTSISPGEFDYPYGEDNRYTRYDGKGGVRLDSIFKKLFYAVSFNHINILISSTINKESRILYRRNIKEMVTNLTPFLEFDEDPYLVKSEGKLYWIIDGYTITNKFPYSTPIRSSKGQINYVRNSFKVVIDAYNGSMDYYVADKNDPILKTYAKIFKGLFKDMSDMPKDLQSHIRYPETIFNIQSKMLLRYHMTNANVFYNNEDAWDIPNQIYDAAEEQMHSYYLVTTLPGEKESGFILILPFTPLKKDNMIAFLIAKCDTPYYGELTLYQLPKEKLSFGPMQIEARVNQDAEISKLLTLWGQKGSRAIRGNMMVIPIEDSVLFIEPLYLKAETSEMPELKRVIVSFADRIAMEENLPAAINSLFYKGTTVDLISSGIGTEEKLRDYAQKAYNHLLQAEKYQRDGNWAKYGEELRNLKEIIILMRNVKQQ